MKYFIMCCKNEKKVIAITMLFDNGRENIHSEASKPFSSNSIGSSRLFASKLKKHLQNEKIRRRSLIKFPNKRVKQNLLSVANI